MRTVGILTSGGDSPGMNAAIRGAVRTAIFYGHRVIGIKNGYRGIFSGEMEEMDLSSVADIIHRGGTILGTSRCEEMETLEGQTRAAQIIKQRGIDRLIVIGGDGSMKGALSLAQQGVSVSTIPATIDNDLGYQDASIGFFTAIETIIEAIAKIRDTSSAHKRANIVEVMGRHCGDLALYAGIAGGAESILVPEKDFVEKDLINKVLSGKQRGKRHHIILMTEGSMDPYQLAKKVEETTEIETRVTILGYIQRGGSPSALDRINASILGERAISSLEDPSQALALGMKQGKVISIDLEQALSIPKVFDEKLYQTLQVVSI